MDIPAALTRGIAGLAIAVALAGAASPVLACSGKPFAARDDHGRCITLPAPARRVVTLSPHATEMVYAAGGGDHLLATVDRSDFPPEAQALPKLGSGLQVSPERLLALRPDLVVAWNANAIANLGSSLDSVGIPVFYSAPQTLADIPAGIEQLGILLDTEAAAHATATGIRDALRSLERQYADRDSVSVFIQVGADPLFTLTDRHIIGDVLRICGARNIVGESAMVSPTVSLEAVIAAKPALILVPDDAPEARTLWQRYEGHELTSAVHAIDADLLYRPGPRMVDGTRALCETVDAVRHPRPD